MKHILYSLFLALFIASCSNQPQPRIQLKDFTNDVSVKKLGRRLIDLPYGLHSMEPSIDGSQEIFITVHGGSSEGYEWIYPIKTIDTKQKHMYFYRWPDNGCFQSSAEELAVQINNLLSQNNSFKKVSLIGHSYGGIVVTHVLKHWNAPTPLEVHVVASPLLGTSMLRNMCGYVPIETVPNNS